ncbi:MAG: PxxKW family cysteine-rich protein [Thermodesulfobacteriota bacterium]
MLCTTIRNGSDCNLMTKKGCGAIGGACQPVIGACEGCGRVEELSTGLYCKSCPDPTAKWRGGKCNLATHVTEEVKMTEAKLNPLKASKRAQKGK